VRREFIVGDVKVMRRHGTAMRAFFLLGLTLAVAPCNAAASQAAPLPPAIPAPQDRPYPGVITLHVAFDTDHHVFDVTETIPAAPGPLTLLYPRWIPGTHSPEGTIAAMAGLTITAGNTEIPWQRDTVDVTAFHMTVPPAAPPLTLHFQYLSPPTATEGAVVMTDRIALLQFWHTVLYPSGYYVRDIPIRAAIDLPDQWQYGTALEQQSRDGATVTFKPVPLDVLIDSPIYAGRYFARFDLAPGAKVPVHMDAVADAPEDLAITPSDLAAHRAMVVQEERNFASRHYDHFDILVALSDETSSGLEHHRSSENGVPASYFTDPAKALLDHTFLMPHEYAHSWNGKFRRPADLWSPDYNVIPERGSLLWVYEGQTQYWGDVIAARAGLQTPEQFRDYLAYTAADLQAQAGRLWRPLQDTTNDPVINQRRPLAWRSYSRAEDYYQEGAMMWLDADTLIRQATHGHASLTTFAQKFFGIEDGNYGEVTYSFDDVVAGLNAVYPYDWAAFLRKRLDDHPNTDLTDGLGRAGWRLVFSDKPNEVEKAAGGSRHTTSYAFSLGLTMGGDGKVGSVLWGSPAYKAGLSRGVTIVAVNDRELDGSETLTAAVKGAAADKAPIALLVHDGKYFRTVKIDYHGGLRAPHLERIPGTADLLADIMAPLK
jgi:predicted metalloprotease with PDZ domain